MNLTDLTDELQAEAAEARATVAMNRLTGVRQRIRTRRRRQVASAAGLTALGVAAVILVPGVFGQRADRVPAPPTNPAPTRLSDPLSFASDQAGDPLIAHGVSAPGSPDLVLRFTPTDTRLAISDFCRMPGVTAPVKGNAAFTFDLKINGHAFSSGDCSKEATANASTMSYGDDASKENRTAWAELGVVAGRESVIRMTAKPDKGKAAIPPQTRLGVGVYALSGERVVDSGVRIKVQAESDGHRYRLAGHTAAPATATRRRLSLHVPAGTHPVMLLWGNPGDDSRGGRTRTVNLLVDGREQASNSGGSVGSGDVLDDAGPHTVEVTLDPGLRGTMVLAYYVRTD
jgi:hypothetical protein